MIYYPSTIKEKNGHQYVVAREDDTTTPYCVMSIPDRYGKVWQQVSKWYAYKGNALRALDKIVKG